LQELAHASKARASSHRRKREIAKARAGGRPPSSIIERFDERGAVAAQVQRVFFLPRTGESVLRAILNNGRMAYAQLRFFRTRYRL
jgi:hypothetical protein